MSDTSQQEPGPAEGTGELRAQDATVKGKGEIISLVDPYAERGRAVSWAALLDGVLREFLLAYFVPIHRDLEEELFEGSGPFSSFYTRIETAYVLGLISANERKNLNLIRKIRRDFAHKPGGKIRFKQQDIKNRCMALELPQKVVDGLEVDWENPRTKFVGTCLFTISMLVFRKFVTQHLAKTEPPSEQWIDAFLDLREQLRSHFE